MTKRRFHFLPVVVALGFTAGRMDAQEALHNEPVLELCAEYSNTGDLIKASVSAHAFTISIARPSGENIELNGSVSGGGASKLAACNLSISHSSNRAVLALLTKNGLFLQFLNLSTGQLGKSVTVAHPELPIYFPWHPVGFVNQSEQLAVLRTRYLPTDEQEVITQLMGADGVKIPGVTAVTGPKYAEASGSSFDFNGGRVWFLCPGYSARIDSQPHCILTSASMTGDGSSAVDIPPPPDDRVVGSGQPNLGFPSADLAVLLAQDRLWLYSFSTRSFRQMELPETPHDIRWFEFPGQPKFSSDGHIAAVPVYMSHPLWFKEGSISHGTKIVIVDLKTLQILKTIQPDKKANLIDFALHNNGEDLTLVANWGAGWKVLTVPLVHGN